LAKRRPEQIDLNEMGVVDRKPVAKILREPKRVHAEVGSDDRTPPSHAEKITHLAGAAPDLQNGRRVRDLFVEQPRKDARTRLAAKTVARVQTIIIRKRGLFVKLLDDIGHVDLGLGPDVGREQAGNSALDRI